MKRNLLLYVKIKEIISREFFLEDDSLLLINYPEIVDIVSWELWRSIPMNVETTILKVEK